MCMPYVPRARLKSALLPGLIILSLPHGPLQAKEVDSQSSKFNISGVIMLDAGKVKLEIGGEEKADVTVAKLIDHFSVKSDAMLLGA